MAKIVIPDFTSLTNQTSFLEALNAAFASLAEAIENTLSRDGTSPNQMEADLDMNSQRILNLPEPTEDTDPVRLQDLTEGIRGEKGDTGDPGGPLADGDYTDIVVSGTGSVWTIDPTVMTAVARTLNAQATQDLMRTAGLGLGNSSTKDTGTAAGTVAVGDDTRFYKYSSNTPAGDYTFVLTDFTAPTFVTHLSGSTHTYTVPPNSSVAAPVVGQGAIHNSTSGGILTVARGVGVTMYVNGATVSSNAHIAPGGFANIIQIATDVWLIVGVGVTSA